MTRNSRRRRPRTAKFAARHVDDLPEQLASGTVYLVGKKDWIWCAAMRCPCGCGDVIRMSLLPEDSPSWCVEEGRGGGVTLYPSVWRTKGCKSHFWLRRGRIHWALDLNRGDRCCPGTCEKLIGAVDVEEGRATTLRVRQPGAFWMNLPRRVVLAELVARRAEYYVAVHDAETRVGRTGARVEVITVHGASYLRIDRQHIPADDLGSLPSIGQPRDESA
jgi:Family of unknown function (DUF6527)